MAEADDTRACPVCFDEYSAEGDHTPKLLPCTHSLCRWCIEQLREKEQQGAGFTCPICKEKFPGKRDFPENRYILALLKQIEPQTEEDEAEEEDSAEKCGQHEGESLQLYCVTCREPVCERCLHGDHEGHETTTLEQHLEPIEEALRYQVQTLLRDVHTSEATVLKTRSTTRGSYASCLASLKEVVKKIEGERDDMEKKSPAGSPERQLKLDLDFCSDFSFGQVFCKKERLSATAFCCVWRRLGPSSSSCP